MRQAIDLVHASERIKERTKNVRGASEVKFPPNIFYKNEDNKKHKVATKSDHY